MTKSTTSGIYKIFAALILSLICSSAAYSQFSGDFQFYARADVNPKGVHLYWFFENNERFGTVEVWAAEGYVNDMNTPFEKIADINGGWNGDQNKGYEYFLEYNFTGKEYTLYLVANLADSVTQKQSSWAYISFEDTRPGYLYFTSEPVSDAVINQDYYYDADAVYQEDESKEIVYSLRSVPDGLEIPDGMTIDSQTGEITWTPTEAGYYQIWLHAELADDNTITGDQYFDIYVRECEVPGVIKGKIYDKNGELTSNGFVSLMSNPSNNDWKKGQYYGEVTNGEFSIEVDKGSYYLLYSSEMGQYQWYENARDITDAVQIDADCGETTEITMNLDFDNNFEYFTVSGNVSYDDGTPIEFASVYFEGGDNNTRDGVGFTFYAMTDADGNYSVQLPDEYKYIAVVINSKDNILWTKPLYYNQTYNRDDATLIELTGDRNDINFVFDESAKVHFYNVSGVVKDKDNNPLEGVTVIFEGFAGDYNYDRAVGYYEAKTGSDGSYTIELPDYYDYVAYAISIQHGLFIPLYYNQTYFRDSADVIELTGDLAGIDFTVDENNDITWYNVSGNVSYENGNPIEKALVVFEGYTDDREIYYPYNSFNVYTDANGDYSIRLPDIFKYIAYAGDMFESNGIYMPLYYDQTYNPDEADVIELTGDRDDINFVFGDLPGDYTASISGKVINPDNEGIESVWLAAFLTEGTNTRDYNYQGWAIISGQDGSFSFDNLMPGKYVLFAFPSTDEYSPGFYNENGPAVMDWESATVVEVSDDQEIENIQFMLADVTEIVVGTSEITGFIKASKNVLNDAEGAPLPSATTYLTGTGNKVLKYTKTSGDGSFKLTRLAAGEYTLVVDKVGYKKFTKNITVKNDEIVDIGEIELQPESISGKDYDVFSESLAAYPNPASEYIRLNFNGIAGISYITISDALGNHIMSRSVQINSGTNMLELPVSNLPIGSYFIKITNGTQSKVFPIIVNH